MINCKEDRLEFNINNPHGNDEIYNKRNILSSIAKIFDPLGLILPVVMKAKILLQHLWNLKIDWDADLPIEVNRT